MINHVDSIQANEELPTLPAVARTQSGIEFDPRADIWKFRDAVGTVHLRFSNLIAAHHLIQSTKPVLLWYAENASSQTMKAYFSRLVHFFRVLASQYGEPLVEISSIEILNYRAMLTGRSMPMLGGLSPILRRWHVLGIPGVTDDAAKLLNELRIPGGQKGAAVLTMDPYEGPFSDIEFQAIQAEMNSAYAEDRLSPSDHVMTLLFMALGQRPIQYAALKVCDVGYDIADDGTVTYALRVPRAKQHNRLIRDEFTNRLLVPQIGELVVALAKEVESSFVNLLADPKQAPLFPAKRSRGNEPKGFEYHATAAAVSQNLSATLTSLDVQSERTGGALNITAYRFRRTTGTRAAMEGHGELVIAELLDHTDTQNVGIYVEAVPQIVERIDRAMALHMAPMAQAFVGKIITNEAEAARSGDPSSRVCDPRFDPSMKPMGNCGKHGFCGFLAPIACYTCRSFHPWLDGPHEAVLDYLITERERLLAGSDTRIASINDRTILAVAEVVRRCQELRKAD